MKLPIWTIGKIGTWPKLVNGLGRFFSLFHRFQFPEIKPDSFFKLFGGKRLVVRERAEEFVSPGDYNSQYD